MPDPPQWPGYDPAADDRGAPATSDGPATEPPAERPTWVPPRTEAPMWAYEQREVPAYAPPDVPPPPMPAPTPMAFTPNPYGPPPPGSDVPPSPSYGRPAPYSPPLVYTPLAISYPPGYEQPLANGREVSGYGRRVAARLIDVAIFGAIVITLAATMKEGFIHTVVTRQTSTSASASSSLTPLGMGICLLLGLIFEVVIVCTLGGQIGKLALGLRLSSARTVRTPISWGQALGRWGILSVGFFFCFIPGLLFCLSPLWNLPYRQGWHDRAVGTIVTRKQRG